MTFKLFSTFLAVKDSLYEKKVEYVTSFLLTVVLTSRYLTECEAALLCLFRIATVFRPVRKYIKTQKQSEMRSIQEWIRKNSYSGLSTSKGSSTQYEDPDRPNYKVLLEKAEELADGQPPNEDEWNSDEELAEKIVTTECDVLDITSQNWKRAKIISKLGDTLLVSYSVLNQTQITWKDLCSDEVSPPGKRIN